MRPITSNKLSMNKLFTNISKLLKIVLTIAFFHAIYTIKAQKPDFHKRIDSLAYISKIDSLRELYGNNKFIPEEYRHVVYITLSYFPELGDTNIRFKKAKIKTTLNVRPNILSMFFCRKSKRKYTVRINSKLKDSIINYEKVPFNAKIGLLGHEFSHIADYSSRNFFGVASRLVDYAFENRKEEFEKEIDGMTILQGLHWQLYDWSYYVIYRSDASVDYKEFKKKIYMRPVEISDFIDSFYLSKD